VMQRRVAERAEFIMHMLQSPEAREPHSPERVGSLRLWIMRFLALCCIGLVPWIIVLAVTLPHHYVVGNWPLTWVGFDTVELTGLSVTAWALWKQRQILIPVAMITSTLMFSDAWFDVSTARGHGDLLVSILMALFAELPLGILLCLISIRCLVANLRAVRGMQPNASVPSLWRTPLFTRANSPVGAACQLYPTEQRATYVPCHRPHYAPTHQPHSSSWPSG
jgi:hypothetical protein